MKKYDHMSIAGEDGVVLATESASVSLENVLGKERTFIPTTVGQHAFSTKRLVTMIKGKVVMTDGQKFSDLDFVDKRITLRDTESGKRVLCFGCYTGTLGAMGSDNPELVIGVTGGIQEL